MIVYGGHCRRENRHGGSHDSVACLSRTLKHTSGGIGPRRPRDQMIQALNVT